VFLFTSCEGNGSGTVAHWKRKESKRADGKTNAKTSIQQLVYGTPLAPILLVELLELQRTIHNNNHYCHFKITTNYKGCTIHSNERVVVVDGVV